jgi:hypothetical protein
MLLYNMMGNDPFRNGITNAQLKSREISTLHEIKRHGNKGHHWGSHSGDQELVQERTIALVLLWNKLLYSSASDTMAVKHNTKNANAKNTVKAAAPAPLAVVAVSTNSLKLLSTSHLLEDLWRLMATSTRRRPKIRL